MIIRWLFSRTIRQAVDLRHRVRKLVHAQKDLLQPQAIAALGKATEELQRALQARASQVEIQKQMANLETAANKWLKPCPFPGARENVDVLLVALAVALGVRTFFLQPMAIPTGSMQPTLYGITQQDLRHDPNAEIPGALKRLFNSWVRGIKYYRVTAVADGAFRGSEEPQLVFPLVKKQRFLVGDHWYTIWFPPDQMFSGVNRTGLEVGRSFRKGDDIINLRVRSGDRLFVDRLTYNFRRPTRGEIVIFVSQGIPQLIQDTHYIKRLIGLGGEGVRIGNDRHVIVDGKRLDASTPRFENLYSFAGPPRENQYSGHVNDWVGRQNGRPLAPLFKDETVEHHVRTNCFLVFGDNTMNSFDSRFWDDFPREKVIGKCAFVFWPISERFGWGFR